MEASVRRLSEPLVAWRLALVGTLCVLAALCWWWTVDRMSGMDMGPGSDPGTFGFFLTTWVVMMAAMMFPSIAPMVLMYASLDRSRRAWTPLFVAGYLIVWGAAGLIGFGVLKVGASVAGDFFAWDNAGRWTAVAVLGAAAVYEFTPAKYACLRRCRSPLGFLVSSWHEGSVGAVRMGVLHGAWCIGCCWALMAALFVDAAGSEEQRTAMADILTGRAGGTPFKQFPWVWKESHLLGVEALDNEIDHTPGRGWVRAGSRVDVRAREPVADQEPVTCVIPGHHRSGRELISETIDVAADGLVFSVNGRCAYESTSKYSSED
jgi:hypothetical protein